MLANRPQARILIVEDDSLLAQYIQLQLEMLNFAVTGIVPRGEDALRHALRLRPDLILMDITLEGPMDGIEAAKQIHARVDIPVVFLTAHSDEATLQRAKTSWPLAFLLKPLKDEELRLAIEMALYRHGMETRLRQSQEELERRVAERTAELEAANRRLQREVEVHRRTNEALLASEERFRTLFRSAPVGIATAGADRCLTNVNPAFCSMLGYGEAELLHRPILDITHPDDVPKNIAIADRVILGESPLQMEKRYLRKDGGILWTKITGSAIRDADRQFVSYLAIVEDISASKQAERQRLIHEAAQREALVREVHHRIKNNLQGVAGLLRQKLAQHPEVRDILEETIAQLNSVALVYGLQGQKSPDALSLRDMLAAICRATAELTGDAGALRFASHLGAPLRVQANEAVPLALVLNELVQNAFKHRNAAPGQDISIELSDAPGGAAIEIVNPGEFDAAEADEIFQAYHQAKYINEIAAAGEQESARSVLHQHVARQFD